jgi:hypothetical protein
VTIAGVFSKLDARIIAEDARQIEYTEAKIERQLRSITFVNVMNGTFYVR